MDDRVRATESGMKAIAALVLLSMFAGSVRGTSPPDFAHDIAAIVYRNCAGCHHDGGTGPFPLLSYSDIKKHAKQIADVTGRRYMPPWLPEPGYGEFQDERRLTDEQIREIADWVRAGAPEGPAQDVPAMPVFRAAGSLARQI